MTIRCAVCVDNYAGYTLEITLIGGSTGPVKVCWWCLTCRLDGLADDLHPEDASYGRTKSFNVQRLDRPTLGAVTRGLRTRRAGR